MGEGAGRAPELGLDDSDDRPGNPGVVSPDAYLTGTRTYWNTFHVVSDAVARGALKGRPFVTTDAMKYYRWAVGRALHGLAVHAIVEKRFKNGRLAVVDRRLMSGTCGQLEEALFESEDSSTVNTSFIERLT